MPHSLSAKKRMRQNVKTRTRNRGIRSLLKTKMKRFQDALAAKDLEGARQRMKEAERQFRRAAASGPIHKNTASRHISRMAKQLAQLQKQGA